ncbi:MAG: apolipoprotein N-acyltransferase [Proteobacteria bacterium]|nr:apolipoprotein N-acyltransferase [Pseudomonadota bacterium]
MSRRRTFALILLAAVLYFLAFPPFPTGFLACVFLVPFFAALEGNGFHRGARLGYALGFLSAGGLVYWIALNKGTSTAQSVAMLAIGAAYLACAWGVLGLCLAFACRRFGRAGLWAAPLLWTAMEFVQSMGSLGFTWHSVATTQTGYAPVLQLVSATGMFGLSFWIVFLNVLAYRALVAFRGPKEARNGRAALRFALVAAAVAAAPIVYGFVVTKPAAAAGRGAIRAALVQPDTDSNRKFPERNLAYLALMKLTMSLRDGANDVVVWPETATAFVLREHEDRLRDVRELLEAKRASLITGMSDRRAAEGGKTKRVGEADGESRAETIKKGKFRKVNAVGLLRPGSSELETYEKLHLVPFGEYVPPFLGFLEDMAMNVGSGIYVPGTEVRVFEVPLAEGGTAKIAAVICLESNFPALVRRFVDRGAEALVVVANDEWYEGTTEPVQHAEIARLRAVEHRIPVLRCSNAGVSAVIDAYGRVVAASEEDVQAIVSARVPLGPGPSFYSRHGDWFPMGALGLSLILLGVLSALGIRSRLSRRSRRSR